MAEALVGQVVLSVRGLHKSFDGAEIIKGVDLRLHRGERHALIGPNGAGKSTMFNLLSGAFAPSAGEIDLHGRRISGLTPMAINRLGLARSFQISSVFPRLTVLENLRIGAFARLGVRFDVFGRANRHRRANEEADRLVQLVRLERVAEELAGNLSYSDQRALELGLTLSTDPSVILLDEPTAGMSREESEYAVSLIRSVTQGRTLLIVEHDMDVVFSIATRVSVLVYGRIIASGSPEEVKRNPDVQAAYLGTEEAAC